MVADDSRMGTVEAESGAEVRRVLVVDDEPAISELLTIALRYEGFGVAAAATGAEALERFEEFRPQIILLDVMLPDLDGFEVARRLAERRSEVPIIFLTARDTTEDKVRGLSLGGDDYVTKPFSVEELVARIRTILRRTGVVEDEARLVFEGLELDEDTREVFRDGEPIDLTDTEFRLLRYLLLNPRRALTRSQILDHVWNYDFGGDGRVLETYISYLRKKVDRPEPTADPHGARRGVHPAKREVLRCPCVRRLVLGLLALAATGLLILDVVSYAALSSYLSDRVDEQVVNALPAVGRALTDGGPHPVESLPPLPAGFPPAGDEAFGPPAGCLRRAALRRRRGDRAEVLRSGW